VISGGEEEGLRRLMAEDDKGEYRRCLAILLRAKGHLTKISRACSA
jgi:hypothetical protein